MKSSKPHKYYGRWRPWATGTLAFAGLAGTLFALSEVLENDSDGDGWTDAEEIVAGTDPADATDPWDSDGDGIADYLEFLDGTAPLDPNDPPKIRKSPLAYSIAAAGDEAENISLPSLKSEAQQNMYHNTAWFGKRLNYTFFRPTADSKWKAINGNEIEYWSTGYYDLLARNGSFGLTITVESVPAGKYTLKWKHMQRPDGGSTGYTVSVSGAATASKRFTAPKSNSEGTEVLLVKNWHFGTQKGEKTVLVEKFENDHFVETEMTYTHIFLPATPSAEEGFACPGEIVRAQGNSTNPIGFNHHWIVEAAGHYYDPSYGIPKTSIADAGKSYDASAFSGFGILETIEGIMLYSIRKNNISNDDLIITTHNYNSL